MPEPPPSWTVKSGHMLWVPKEMLKGLGLKRLGRAVVRASFVVPHLGVNSASATWLPNSSVPPFSHGLF